ncbi:MAG: SDR family NAD(P)-dependent oxidoreductase [Myxococcota bacterium]|nr:SDR family NAD(P)-dependent oxidoreductase [Myxococcota bacterium]
MRPAPLEGKTCIVTGATSGLGRACAEQLAGLGARLEILCRSPRKAEQARSEIVAATGNAAVGVVIADLESQQAIRAAAKELLDRCERIDLLLNNAGVTLRTRETTTDGIETVFAVNHLAAFLLTNLLVERIVASEGARIVGVASDAHKFGGKLDFDDLQLERRFHWTRAYGRSKGANILFTQELARRLQGSGVAVHCLHPGFVRSNLGANDEFGRIVSKLLSPLAMSSARAGRYVVDVCTRPEFGESTGGYYYKARPHRAAAWARDDASARRLWALSEALVGLDSPIQDRSTSYASRTTFDRALRIEVAPGITLAGDAWGDPGAQPVVLLHGGGQTRHAWSGTGRALAEAGWYAMAFDLRGHGDSSWSPDGRYGPDCFADDVAALTRQLPAPPILVGASLGGVASLMAVDRTGAGCARALVLVDIATQMEPEGVERIIAFMTDEPDGFSTLEDAADAVARYNHNRPRPKDVSGLAKNLRQGEDGRWRWHWDPRFLDGKDEIRTTDPERQMNLEEAARKLTLPTLLVRGQQSDVLSEQGAGQFLALAPSAEYADISGAGHMVAGDRNDAFSGAVLDFLRRRELGPERA